jgi:hypothetical protein
VDPPGGRRRAGDPADHAATPDGGRLRIRYWTTLDELLAGRSAREFLVARRLSACNEGTPSIRQISLDAGVEASRIEFGFHYHRDCQVDRQARGTLSGFRL